MKEENQSVAADAQSGDCADPVFSDHVARELERIADRLRAPDPFHHAGLYAAQQALCWAAHPEAYASPTAAIMGNEAGRECYSAQPHPIQS